MQPDDAPSDAYALLKAEFDKFKTQTRMREDAEQREKAAAAATHEATRAQLSQSQEERAQLENTINTLKSEISTLQANTTQEKVELACQHDEAVDAEGVAKMEVEALQAEQQRDRTTIQNLLKEIDLHKGHIDAVYLTQFDISGASELDYEQLEQSIFQYASRLVPGYVPVAEQPAAQKWAAENNRPLDDADNLLEATMFIAGQRLQDTKDNYRLANELMDESARLSNQILDQTWSLEQISQWEKWAEDMIEADPTGSTDDLKKKISEGSRSFYRSFFNEMRERTRSRQQRDNLAG